MPSQLILESISDVVEVIDPQGTIIYTNLSPARQRQLSLDNIQGRKCHQVYDRLCVSCAVCPLDEVFSTGARLTRDAPVSLGPGRQGWARQRLYPVKDREGRTRAVLRMVFDISKEKQDQIREENYISSLEQSLARQGPGAPSGPVQALSPREREVLSFMTEGMSNLEIARVLGISLNTVKTHVVHIFNKLGVDDRTQAAVLATRLELA